MEECTTTVRDTLVTVSEKNKRFVVENKKHLEIHKTQVDDCLFDVQVEKCDWIIHYHDQDNRAHYIELKGSDIEKGYSQLRSTLRLTQERFAQHEKRCHIVCHHVPKAGPKAQQLAKRFKKETGLSLTFHRLEFILRLS
jgi:hypothetical protein